MSHAKYDDITGKAINKWYRRKAIIGAIFLVVLVSSLAAAWGIFNMSASTNVTVTNQAEITVVEMTFADGRPPIQCDVVSDSQSATCPVVSIVVGDSFDISMTVKNNAQALGSNWYFSHTPTVSTVVSISNPGEYSPPIHGSSTTVVFHVVAISIGTVAISVSISAYQLSPTILGIALYSQLCT